MNRLLYFLVSVSLTLLLAACGTAAPKTSAFVASAHATAIAATSDGGLIYASKENRVLAVDKNGKASETPIAQVSSVGTGGVIGLVQDSNKRVFASWVMDKSDEFVIAQIAPGATRFVYRSHTDFVAPQNAELIESPEHRILSAAQGKDGSSHVISVDPDRNDDQRANDVSSGWRQIGGFAYATGGVLWVSDNTDADVRISRAGPDGSTGTVTTARSKDRALSMTAYGDSEFAICFGNSGVLQRHFISDGVQVLRGRVLARGCSGDVVQLAGGRLAYVSNADIRVTAL